LRGCWGSDFSHFYRGVQIVSDTVKSRPWVRLQQRLKRYDLSEANQALNDVAGGKLFKALVSPGLVAA
jgi:L-iditol 2-dehydrogenase